jgi:hypothetical protein
MVDILPNCENISCSLFTRGITDWPISTMGGPPAAEVEEEETIEASSSITIAEDAGTAMEICRLFLSRPCLLLGRRKQPQKA